MPDQNRWRRTSKQSFSWHWNWSVCGDSHYSRSAANWTLTLIHRSHLSPESLSCAGLLGSFSCKDCLFCLEDSTMNRLIRQYHNGDKVMSLPVIKWDTCDGEDSSRRRGNFKSRKVYRFLFSLKLKTLWPKQKNSPSSERTEAKQHTWGFIMLIYYLDVLYKHNEYLYSSKTN